MKLRILLGAGLLAAAFSALPTAGWGQASVPKWEDLARSYDRNGDGVIDPVEVRFVPPPFRESLTKRGVDLSQPIRVETLHRTVESYREELEKPGGRAPDSNADETGLRIGAG